MKLDPGHGGKLPAIDDESENSECWPYTGRLGRNAV